MSLTRPRLILSALSGGSGKTTLSLALLAAWRKRGLTVTPFKKGPDYIDAGWLSATTGQPCRNLDPFLMDWEKVHRVLCYSTAPTDLAVIEGNRGLFDGLDADGSTSTAELAKRLKIPVILIVDVTKVTRTVAALVLGCVRFDPDVRIAGVILNRVGGPRHERVIRECLAKDVGVPVLGALPRLKIEMPERHMGLVPTPEHAEVGRAIEQLAQVAEERLNLQALLEVAKSAPELEPPLTGCHAPEVKPPTVKIGIIRDEAFQFYYPENMEALERAGAEIVYISAINDQVLPEVDGLYIGGGFPETQAEGLTANGSFRDSIKKAAEAGLPVYAECGGMMFLARQLTMAGKTYPMSGVLPIDIEVLKKPQGHGYTAVTVDRPNPFYPVGTLLKGHEFHYSRVVDEGSMGPDLFSFRVDRGVGMAQGRDGICIKNVLATYTHIHALGTPLWAEGLVKKAEEWKGGEG